VDNIISLDKEEALNENIDKTNLYNKILYYSIFALGFIGAGVLAYNYYPDGLGDVVGGATDVVVANTSNILDGLINSSIKTIGIVNENVSNITSTITNNIIGIIPHFITEYFNPTVVETGDLLGGLSPVADTSNATLKATVNNTVNNTTANVINNTTDSTVAAINSFNTTVNNNTLDLSGLPSEASEWYKAPDDPYKQFFKFPITPTPNNTPTITAIT